MEGGGLSVMMGLDRMMLMLLVDNWDTSEPAVLMMCVDQGMRKFTLSIISVCHSKQFYSCKCGYL